MALSLADLVGTLGCAVVVKGVAVHILALGEDTTAALSGLQSFCTHMQAVPTG